MSVDFEKDEYIVHEVRKHWFFLFTHVFFSLVLLLVPAFIYAGISILPVTLIFPGNPTVLFLFLYTVWFFLIWVSIIVMWTDYYLDVWIITNKRLIDVEQQGLFRREIASVDLGKIQDVTSEVDGIFATFMKFGNLNVQTAGSEREFVIRNIENPGDTRQKLHASIRNSSVENI